MAKKRTRTKRDAPGADHNSAPAGVSSLSDDEQRALFQKHREAFAAAKAKLASVTGDLRNVRKRIKADGFTVAMVEDALALATPEGEERIRTEHARRLTVCRWLGMELAVAASAQANAFEQ